MLTRLIPLFIACMVHAHDGQPIEPHDLATAWSWDPVVVILLVASAYAYAVGARQRRGVRPLEMLCFWTGWTFAAGALVSPLHALGEALFSAHMAQHEVLMLLAAPLLVLGKPINAFLWSMPKKLRRPAGRLSTWTPSALHAWWIHFAALWVWHIPALFQATINSDFIHALQHASFFISAVLFWWALFRRHGAHRQYGSAAFYIFTTMVHTGVLGALLTFSTVVWYPAYVFTTRAWGLTALEDQQLGGLIMFVPPIAVYLLSFLAVFGLWVRDSDLRYREAETR